MPTLISGSAVTGEDLCSSTLHHLRVFDRLLDVREDPELGGDGDVKIYVEDVDFVQKV